MADVLTYRRKLERERNRQIGDAAVISMRNICDAQYRQAQSAQRDRQLQIKLACALREIYMIHGDGERADDIRVQADQEARKILQCRV